MANVMDVTWIWSGSRRTSEQRADERAPHGQPEGEVGGGCIDGRHRR